MCPVVFVRSAGAAVHSSPDLADPDQIRLWEQERLRLKFQATTLFRGFTSETEFNNLFNFAQQNKLVLWSNVDSKMFVTVPEGVDAIRESRNQLATASG